jgi:hypothetical protein
VNRKPFIAITTLGLAVSVARDLYCGYELARGDAPEVAKDACRNAMRDSQPCESLSAIHDTI